MAAPYRKPKRVDKPGVISFNVSKLKLSKQLLIDSLQARLDSLNDDKADADDSELDDIEAEIGQLLVMLDQL